MRQAASGCAAGTTHSGRCRGKRGRSQNQYRRRDRAEQSGTGRDSGPRAGIQDQGAGASAARAGYCPPEPDQCPAAYETGRAVRYGNERNYVRYLERVSALEARVRLAQERVLLLERQMQELESRPTPTPTSSGQ